MAGDWIKMAPNVERKPQFWKLCQILNQSEDSVGYKLYQLADWFHRHGDYGNMKGEPIVIDMFLKTEGFADALRNVGWLRVHEENMTLFGFCEASTVRKSLGRKVRSAVLSAGKCNACGSTEDLVIDHIIPIARGGSSDIKNLQPLCSPCNRSKGKKMPSEWRP